MKTLLIVVAAFALITTVGRKLRNNLNGNYDDVVVRVKMVQGIRDAFVGDEDQGFGEINAGILWFGIVGKPESWVEIWSPDADLFKNASHIGVGRIGRMKVSVSHFENGELMGGGCVDIGPDSDLKHILPFTPRNLNELIARYDELEAYFAKWPMYPETAKMVVSPTTTIKYCRSN